MFVKNLLKISLGSIIYPIVNLPALAGPYLMTVVLYSAVAYAALQLDLDAMITNGMAGDYKSIAIVFGLFFVLLLVAMPLLAAVTRNVVLSEEVSFMTLARIFNPREIKMVLAWMKMFIIFLLPLIAAGIVLSFMGGFMSMPVPDFGLKLGLVLGNIVLLLAYLLGLYLLARASMAPITGALDKGVSTRNSFKMTCCNGLLIFSTIVVIMLLMSLVMWLVLSLTGMFGAVLDVKLVLAMSPLEKLALIVEIVAVRLIAAIILIAALSKLYVVIASKG